MVLEKKIFKWSHPISTVLWLSPLWRDLTLYLHKLEFPSPKDNLYQVWLNLVGWFWRRFFKIFSVFLLSHYYLPLEKSYPLHLYRLEFPPPKDDWCQVWLKLAQWFWRSRKCKSSQIDWQTDGWTNAGQRAIRKAHLSFQFRWAKKILAQGSWLLQKQEGRIQTLHPFISFDEKVLCIN
jgi:hypothetical protein